MLNPVLAPDASAASICRYPVIAAATISVIWRGMGSGAGFSIKRLSLFTLCSDVLILIHSLLFIAVVHISVLNVVS